MSEQSASSAGGSGGIRLPPISFLSAHTHANGNQLPSASNMGISNFLGGPSLHPPQPHHGPPGFQSHQSINIHNLQNFNQNYQNLNHNHQNHQNHQSHQNHQNHQNQHHHHHHQSHHHQPLPPHLMNQPFHLENRQPDDQIAKRLKLENDERLEATSSLTSLSHGIYEEKEKIGNKSKTTQNNKSKAQALFISPGFDDHQQLPQQINDEIERHLLATSLVDVDDSVELPKDNLLPKLKGKSKSKGSGVITLNIKEVEAIIEEFYPIRKYLGTIVYNPTTTWATLQILSLPGLKEEDFDKFIEIKQNYIDKLISDEIYKMKYIPMIPHLPFEYINHLIELKIPNRFIEPFKRKLKANETTRELWGGAGGIYTDDSDILCVLAHLGLFEDKSEKSNLKLWGQPSDYEIIEPMGDNSNNDLSVEIILLPPLPSYHGYYANGINSRSWTGPDKHDGLSIAVHNIKWETCDTYLHDKQTFKRYQGELSQDKQILKNQQNQKPGWSFKNKNS